MEGTEGGGILEQSRLLGLAGGLPGGAQGGGKKKRKGGVARAVDGQPEAVPLARRGGRPGAGTQPGEGPGRVCVSRGVPEFWLPAMAAVTRGSLDVIISVEREAKGRCCGVSFS